MKQLPALLLGVALLAAPAGHARDVAPDGHHAPGLVAVDAYTLKAEKNLLTDYEPKNADGTINVVIEIAQ